MKKLSAFTISAVAALAMSAQDVKTPEGFTFKPYGRVSSYIFYNSRACEETADGLFFMYPKNHDYDPDGNDLNATAQGSMYAIYTRLGVDIAGPRLGSARTSAKVEVDFRGSGTTYAVPRIRHAYFNLNWRDRNALLVGQTWHPLFGEVSPSMINMSTGAPFQPFGRFPQVRYRYTGASGMMLTAAAVWQMQYNSVGPDGKSNKYLKNSNVPEFFFGVDYRKNGWMVGAGVDVLSLRPRQTATVDGQTFKVNERVTSVSGELHVKYAAKDWFLSGKTTLANNLTQCSMLGGFGVIDEDARTGERDYTPFRHSMSWVNFVYGKKWQYGVFLGYLKNLGTGKEITGPKYGTGLDVDQLFSSNWQVSYNLPHWKFGVEFEASTAWYGDFRPSDGRVVNTSDVTNYRVMGVAMFVF